MPTSTEWFVFLGTALLFAITPGPGVLYVLARSMRGGRTEGIRSTVGNGIGASVHVVAAAVGLSALLATSTVAFAVVKYAGAVYLIGLGLHAILRRNDDGDLAPAGAGPVGRWARSSLLQGVFSELLNPKTALYFMALLPHFVHPEQAPAALVFILLGLIAVAMAVAVDLGVAFSAGRLSALLERKPRWKIRQRVASGLTMIGLGGFVAATE